MTAPVRIAMWSGPRNISTAMMRSWGSRADTAVSDEPFYAHYLRATGVDHPGRDEVLAAHEADWRAVVRHITGPVPGGRAIWYQKHMAHHLLPVIDRGWMDQLRHGLLIRDPRAMIASFARVVEHPTAADLGLPQQESLLAWLESRGHRVPIVDARDVLEDPPGMLRALCGALGVRYDPAMLSWEPGLRPTDGVWARHWYAAVERSTGFAPYVEATAEVPEHLRSVHEECRAIYGRLHARRLRPAS